MRRTRRLIVCLIVVAICGVAASVGSASTATGGAARSAGVSFAADFPGSLVVPASPTNFSVANRPADYPISMVVIHVAEGSAAGTAAEFQRAGAEASAHYVVSSTGLVRQLVPEHDIAWHAGNWLINTESVGIEHEGFTAKGGFSAAEYQGSAQLLGSILDRYAIPPNRTHVIGHDEVPDPDHAGLFGGASHHTDPGRHWAWTSYMAMARLDARDTPQSSVGLPGGRPALRKGSVVTYAPAIGRADTYDLFAQTPCGWRPAKRASRLASLAITTAGGVRHATVGIGPSSCGHAIWIGSYRLVAGHPRSITATLPAHAGAPGIIAVESRDLVAPTLPAALGVSAVTDTTAHVSWTAGADAIGVWGYTVQVGAGPLQRVAGAANVQADIGSLTCGTVTTISVRAVDLAGNASAPISGSFVTAACPPPTTVQPPSNLTVISVTQTSVTLGWTAPTGTAPTGYTVTVGAAPGEQTPATSITISDLPCSSSLTAAVSSFDSAGTSSAAIQAPVQTEPCSGDQG